MSKVLYFGAWDLRFDKERQIYTSKIGENLPHGVRIFPVRQKADGDDNRPESVPQATVFLGEKFPSEEEGHSAKMSLPS